MEWGDYANAVTDHHQIHARNMLSPLLYPRWSHAIIWDNTRRAAQANTVQGTNATPSGGREFAPALGRAARAEGRVYKEAAPADDVQSRSSHGVQVPGPDGHTVHSAEVM